MLQSKLEGKNGSKNNSDFFWEEKIKFLLIEIESRN